MIDMSGMGNKEKGVIDEINVVKNELPLPKNFQKHYVPENIK